MQISELGKYLSKVSSKEEPMDMEKINRLKQQIENGTYKVDSRILAKKNSRKIVGGEKNESRVKSYNIRTKKNV
ncbi:hypothetical protein ANS014_00490 [Paraclostridium bifermentans]|nr:hypothetical protein ANS014_00490 [Paraclostridium bifermentans]